MGQSGQYRKSRNKGRGGAKPVREAGKKNQRTMTRLPRKVEADEGDNKNSGKACVGSGGVNASKKNSESGGTFTK